MGNTVRKISSHSQFGSGRQTDSQEEATGSADKDVEKAVVKSINTKQADSAMHLQQANQVIEDLPVIDKERIENIKSRIHNGTFNINTESIVEKLLQTEDLLK